MDYSYAYLGLTPETAYELQRKDLVPISKEALEMLTTGLAKAEAEVARLQRASWQRAHLTLAREAR